MEFEGMSDGIFSPINEMFLTFPISCKGRKFSIASVAWVNPCFARAGVSLLPLPCLLLLALSWGPVQAPSATSAWLTPSGKTRHQMIDPLPRSIRMMDGKGKARVGEVGAWPEGCQDSAVTLWGSPMVVTSALETLALTRQPSSTTILSCFMEHLDILRWKKASTSNP